MKQIFFIFLIIFLVKAFDQTQCQLCKDAITTNIGAKCYNSNYTQMLSCSNVYSTAVVNFDICVAKSACYTSSQGYNSKCVCSKCRDKQVIQTNPPYKQHWDCSLSSACGGGQLFNRNPDTDECYASIYRLSFFSFLMTLIIIFI